MTIVTMQPNGISGQSSPFTVTGAASANAAVSDGSDSSYITPPGTYAFIRFTLPVQSVSATQRVKSLTARARGAYSGSGGSPQVGQIQLMDKSNPQATGTFQIKRTSTSPSTSTGPTAYNTPFGNSWTGLVSHSLPQYAVTIQLQSLPNNGIRCHELYVDIDLNNQPVVSGVGVSNFTNNAAPTVTWAWADIDGDVQSRYRIKIFNATQVAAGNFNPETSVADYDSGEKIGSVNSVDLSQTQTVFFDRFGNPYIIPGAAPPALQNGVTYTAYVKAAHDWPVAAEGPVWYSAWAASSPFTVTFTPPPTPVINSAAILADTNQYRALLSTLVPVNLLTADNASFEGSIGQWVAVSNCTVAVTGIGADGTSSMRMTSTAGGDMEAKCNFDLVGNPFVYGNELYTALASFRAMTVGRNCQVGLEYVDIAGSTISTVFGSSTADVVGSFTQALFQPTVPANARQAKLHVKVLATAAAGEVHLVDKCDVHAGGSTTWTPGGYNNNQGDLVVERLEYLNDARGPAENWFHPQVASCGTVLQNQGYGFAINTAQSDLNWKWLDKLIPAVGDTPAGMLDWRPSLAAVSQIDFGNWFYGGTAFMAPVLANQVHIFSIWAWCDVTTFVAQPFIVWRDKDGGFLSATGGAAYTLSTTPQRILVVATAPANAVLANGAVQNFASDNGHHVYFTRAGFGLGSIPVDGKRAQGLNTGISSTGTPVGASWKRIRFAQPELSGLQPGFAFGQIEQAPDYDYPPGRPAIYRASITYSSGSNIIKSAYSNQLVAYGAPPTQTLLRSVTNPLLQIAVNRRKQATFAVAADLAMFHPLGADGGPVQTQDWIGGEDGQLIVITSTEAQRARLNDLLYANDVMLIQWAQGGRTYCQITARAMDETISADLDFCDAEGLALQDHIRYLITTLTYIETVMP